MDRGRAFGGPNDYTKIEINLCHNIRNIEMNTKKRDSKTINSDYSKINTYLTKQQDNNNDLHSVFIASSIADELSENSDVGPESKLIAPILYFYLAKKKNGSEKVDDLSREMVDATWADFLEKSEIDLYNEAIEKARNYLKIGSDIEKDVKTLIKEIPILKYLLNKCIVDDIINANNTGIEKIKEIENKNIIDHVQYEIALEEATAGYLSMLKYSKGQNTINIITEAIDHYKVFYDEVNNREAELEKAIIVSLLYNKLAYEVSDGETEKEDDIIVEEEPVPEKLKIAREHLHIATKIAINYFKQKKFDNIAEMQPDLKGLKQKYGSLIGLITPSINEFLNRAFNYSIPVTIHGLPD
jgi:hypothetical protein